MLDDEHEQLLMLRRQYLQCYEATHEEMHYEES